MYVLGPDGTPPPFPPHPMVMAHVVIPPPLWFVGQGRDSHPCTHSITY